MELTSEQEAIIAAEPTSEQPAKVTAFAGSGKTFTLKEYAVARPERSMLYVAYNKSIQMEADRKMPRNVESRTVHSLAFRKVGRLYREKLGNLRVGDIMRYLDTGNYRFCYFVSESIKRYVASADPKLCADHLPKGAGKALSSGDAKRVEGVERDIIRGAKAVWGAMCDKDSKDVNMSHDGYLKLYQLQDPWINAQLILMDEAQDTTPCVWDIIQQQKVPKVVVGDQHQAIYGWRGAVDFLSRVETDPALDLSLTTSFRFGPVLAKKASILLHNLKGEDRELLGNSALSTEVLHETKPAYPDGSLLVCRGNAEVLRVASRESESRKIGFIGGSDGYRLQLILDVLALYEGRGREAKNPLVRAFKDFVELVEFAEVTEDNELSFACKVVSNYGSGVQDLVTRIRKAEVDPKHAQLVFSTVHKAKGLEWPLVYLGEDLTSLILAHWDNPREIPYSNEEVNILYVAMTRGISRVVYHPVIEEFLKVGRGGYKSKYSW